MAGDEWHQKYAPIMHFSLVNAMAGREVRMAELKGVIRQLRAQLEEAGLAPVADDPLLAGWEE